MAKRKRSAPALSTSVSAYAAAPTIPETSKIPPTTVPLSENVADTSKPTRRRNGNPAQILHNAKPDDLHGRDNSTTACRNSPDGGKGLGCAPELTPATVSSRPESNILPDSGTSAGGGRKGASASAEAIAGAVHTSTVSSARDDKHTYETTAAGGASQQHASTHEPESARRAVHVKIPKPRDNKRQKAVQEPVNADTQHRSHSPSVKAAQREADGQIIEPGVGVIVDPEAEDGRGPEEGEEEVREALSRPPPVNSAYLPLPWKGRLGYACLNTYLRNANPPVFSSRTCRIASILEHRHPLLDPSQPEHATKNRPDRDQPANVARGQKYVEELGLANARDIIKMLRWNDKYGIKFMRLSSEMFPFASHLEYGYSLAPFASETLREVGKVVAELGHRVTTHPGQYTQLGSPRKEVIDASIRDLDYHDEMLSLMKLPPQQDRDAVMILHLGGVFGDKEATLHRFRKNYRRLSQSVQNRLVLENDDVSWSVHDLLPVCQELNIPMVLDFHHHNIVFDADKIREGTKDIMDLFPAILETWKRKNITPKMHYSEPCPDAITARSRRKHAPRVQILPPCPDTMDLMIEAKDKEQAVFELMRTYKLPGFDLFNDVIPHVRQDENRPVKARAKKTPKKGRKNVNEDEADEEEDFVAAPTLVPEEEVGMGGPERRVYWPPGMEDWLRPPKRVVKKKEDGAPVVAGKKRKTKAVDADVKSKPTPVKKAARKRNVTPKKKVKSAILTPSELSEFDEVIGDDISQEDEPVALKNKLQKSPVGSRRRSGRAGRVSYKEEDGDLSS